MVYQNLLRMKQSRFGYKSSSTEDVSSSSSIHFKFFFSSNSISAVKLIIQYD